MLSIIHEKLRIDRVRPPEFDGDLRFARNRQKTSKNQEKQNSKKSFFFYPKFYF